ncbi:MAG: T9SS type A sorting domain-containing protein [Balneolales bacterium]|nr:T9SS type A sorting domain-containing protein [Balneolales bacterium]
MESGDLTDGLLGPFQGFFVQATGASPELIIPESARTTAAAGNYFRAPEGHQLRLQLVAELQGEGIPTLRSSLWAGTHPEGGAGDAPSLHDALRLYPLDFRPFLSLYTTAGGRALSIRSLSEEVLTDTGTVLPVWTDAWKPGSGGYVPASGTLSLSWPRLEGLPAGAQLLLEDTQTGTFTDLTQAGSYTITLGDAASPVQAARPLPPAPDFSRAAEGTVAPPIGLPAPLTVVADPRTALPDQDPQPRLRLHLLPAPLSTVPPETGGLSLPQQLRLDQNYPNPFNPSTQIRFQLPETAEVRLEVFNIQGQRVALLLRETRPAGTHTITFDAGPLASGVYLYRLQTGTQVLTRKMTVLK